MSDPTQTPALADLEVLPSAHLVCPEGASPRVGIIIVGNEILSGKRQDKHLTHFIGLLAERGMSLSWARYVGDERDDIAPVLAEAFAAGDWVFCCGGIGATPDDQTRQSAAQALGVPLVLHPQAKVLIQARMQETAAEKGQPYEPERPDNLHRLNMGMFPQGASLLPNPYNRIPGFSCVSVQGGVVHFGPGFPVMSWPMMAWALDHYAKSLQHRKVVSERSVLAFEVAEGTLGPMLEALLQRHPRVKVFSLPTVAHPELGPHIEVGVKGEAPDTDKAYAELLQALRSLKARLGAETVRGA